jgi:hypothetical protein
MLSLVFINIHPRRIWINWYSIPDSLKESSLKGDIVGGMILVTSKYYTIEKNIDFFL